MADIPPQDTRQHCNELSEAAKEELPVEIKDVVSQYLGYRMTLEEAKEHRLKLMEERTVAKDVVTQAAFARNF